MKPDAAEALKWYSKAADKGNEDAQFSLGWMFMKGRAPLSIMKKRPCYSGSADKDHDGAEWALGQLYLEGKGVRKDYLEALKWFKKAGDRARSAQCSISPAFTRKEGAIPGLQAGF